MHCITCWIQETLLVQYESCSGSCSLVQKQRSLSCLIFPSAVRNQATVELQYQARLGSSLSMLLVGNIGYEFLTFDGPICWRKDSGRVGRDIRSKDAALWKPKASHCFQGFDSSCVKWTIRYWGHLRTLILSHLRAPPNGVTYAP